MVEYWPRAQYIGRRVRVLKGAEVDVFFFRDNFLCWLFQYRSHTRVTVVARKMKDTGHSAKGVCGKLQLIINAPCVCSFA